MRIGILTFHRAINYGAVLQCYALYKTLKNLGHDVEVIDYRPEYIEKYREFFYKKDFQQQGIVGKIRYVLSCLFTVGSKRTVSLKFDAFLKEYIKTSNVVRCIKDIPSGYDAIFFGSDQIWGLNHGAGLDPIYYGQFPKNGTRFIAYAPSVGLMELVEGDNFVTFKKNLLSFDSISVREGALHDFLLEKCAQNSHIVCDPSLLLERGEYKEIAQNPNDENYVLLFSLTDDPEAFHFAERIAKQIGAKVIQMKAVLNLLHIKTSIRGNLAPEEFIGYIQYARCVVTNSFHATSFSIILKRDFYTLRRSTKNGRSQFLLDKMGFSDRLVDTGQNISYKPINYEGIDLKIDAFRKESLNFILEGLFKGKK